MRKIIVTGITGASGSIYALNFLKHAADLGVDLRVVITEMGAAVFKHETGTTLTDALMRLDIHESNGSAVKIYDNNDMFAEIASGSFKTDGMVVLPCSTKTLSGIANGYSASLLERSADVMLKEKRPLILAVRETPLNLIHLKNMTAAAEAGAVILPAAPGFYNRPDTIEELLDFITGKILDQLKIEHKLKTVWGE
jgi:4-hydroxy-3-polyprenylbenzoate decarboxylase